MSSVSKPHISDDIDGNPANENQRYKGFRQVMKVSLFFVLIPLMSSTALRTFLKIPYDIYADLHKVVNDVPINRYAYDSSTLTIQSFISQFEEVVLANLSKGNMGRYSVVPLIIENGKLLCRSRHTTELANYRLRSFVQMVQKGLKLVNVTGSFPFLVMKDDGNGCDVTSHIDHVQYPRLTWSIPSHKFGEGWCGAISMPCYASWMKIHPSHMSEERWTEVFSLNEKQYPWSSKKDKAVWRGSTTYASQFRERELNETPRGRLVKQSMENPELIDAGFTKINQKFAPQREKLAGETIVTKKIPFRDMMKYKGML